MKTMTCKQLGGACDKEFHAKTFEEMAEMSQKHGMEMFEKGDEEHIKVMNEMREFMNDPEAMREWMESKKKEFDTLPAIPTLPDSTPVPSGALLMMLLITKIRLAKELSSTTPNLFLTMVLRRM